MKEKRNILEDITPDDHGLIKTIMGLPHKILCHHDIEQLHGIVLHELGHDSCFGLKKAVYLVDNPDFDHLVGRAGFCKNECKYHKSDLWEDPALFHQDMKEAEFYNAVRLLSKYSLKKKGIDLDDSEDVLLLGREMGMQSPHFYSWRMKHGNHGLLLFEKEKDFTSWRQGVFNNIIALLGLCGS
jgi:hypothetical protein